MAHSAWTDSGSNRRVEAQKTPDVEAADDDWAADDYESNEATAIAVESSLSAKLSSAEPVVNWCCSWVGIEYLSVATETVSDLNSLALRDSMNSADLADRIRWGSIYTSLVVRPMLV